MRIRSSALYDNHILNRLKMKQSELLISVIYQIIGENKFLLDAIEFVKSISNYNIIEIDIVHNRNCGGSFNDGKIIIGIPDILDFYTIANELFPNLSFPEDYIIDTKYSDWGNQDNIRNKVSVYLSNAEQTPVFEKLDGSDLFKSNKLSDCDKLTIYALAYSLCHEIGHVLHDRYIQKYEFFTKEHIADIFSFEAIKSISCNNKVESILKGAIIGIAQMLMHRTPQQEIDDKEHPHSIERLYSILDLWGVEDDSPYWELAYNIVLLWCGRNKEPVTWERATSISSKDKFIDAYVNFRKNPKQIK